VHDYLTQRGGAERVVLALCRAFPHASVHTALYDPDGTFEELRQRDVRPLWLNRATLLRRKHRLALPALPAAFRTSHVEADVVICSSSGFAHGIRTEGRKLVYCHSPAKWLYRRDDYLGTYPSKAARLGLHLLDPYLRRFDHEAARSADLYIANSTYVASQVRREYGLDAEVLCPPAGLPTDGPREPIPGIEPGFFLLVSRLMPYKNIAQVVEAFRDLPRESLVIVGIGPERDRLMADLPGNVRFLGKVSDESLRWLYASSAGLVAASREDFGLTPVEAASFGKPIVALRWGGFIDTVTPQTGVFFEKPEPKPIAAAVKQLLAQVWDSHEIREHAGTFSEARFVDRMHELVGAVSTLPAARLITEMKASAAGAHRKPKPLLPNEALHETLRASLSVPATISEEINPTKR
jgi:glycosyltransferase involved in cell wall biosynthesis